MTREEAIKTLQWYVDDAGISWEDFTEAFDMALNALRPVSREQVQRVWRGEWKFEPDIYDCGTYVCSKCGEPWTLIDGTPIENNMNFCPNCGAPMTDEAVQMVMERLEEIL